MNIKEVVLLYDIMSEGNVKRIENTCRHLHIELKKVRPEEYRVPVGFLAYGTDEQKKEYMTGDDPLPPFDEPMMVLAGLTNDRLYMFMEELQRHNAPYVALKAVLTEYNAVWDSMELFEELKKENEFMKNPFS